MSPMRKAPEATPKSIHISYSSQFLAALKDLFEQSSPGITSGASLSETRCHCDCSDGRTQRIQIDWVAKRYANLSGRRDAGSCGVASLCGLTPGSLRNFRLLGPHIPGYPLCAHHHTADGLPAALTTGARERPWVGLGPQHHRINKFPRASLRGYARQCGGECGSGIVVEVVGVVVVVVKMVVVKVAWKSGSSYSGSPSRSPARVCPCCGHSGTFRSCGEGIQVAYTAPRPRPLSLPHSAQISCRNTASILPLCFSCHYPYQCVFAARREKE
ncbi:hypothetical protein E2C01_048665 [Portunus trituberculatus]|uniref:Uncharacterized protein n=1 Tax=Portunus trituberculatus TaxID=210409 RepID=A0A5B7G3P3_PORTR|nr:hypothetical protein [Portunus trituberculatus]